MGGPKINQNAPKIKTSDVLLLLREKYGDHRQFAYAEEVGNATGFEQTRRLDAVAVNVYNSKGYTIEGIEVKVSRADLRRELEDSSKHNVFYDNLDYFSLATTRAVLDATNVKDEIPAKWGIYYASDANGKLLLKTYRKPLSLHDSQAPDIARPFFASLIRAICNQTPSATAIEAARMEGKAEASREYELKLACSDAAKIEELQKELRACDHLRRELGVWGAGSIEHGIERYKAMSSINLTILDARLKLLQDTINDIKKQIPKAIQSRY